MSDTRHGPKERKGKPCAWLCAWLGLQVGGVLSKSLGRLARALCLTMARKFDTICEFPGASGDVQLNHLNVTLLSN